MLGTFAVASVTKISYKYKSGFFKTYVEVYRRSSAVLGINEAI